MKWWGKILDIIFPQVCLGCGQSGTYICMDCLATIPHAVDEPGAETYSVFPYRNPIIRKSVWALKYEGKTSIAECLSVPLADKLIDVASEYAEFNPHQQFLIVPIPISRERRKTRGYNQTELLAKAALKHLPEQFSLSTKLLQKNRDTKRQVEISDRRKRLKNLRGSFVVDNASVLSGKIVILLDDIVTTGATIEEARRALRAAGSSHIIAVTLAH